MFYIRLILVLGILFVLGLIAYEIATDKNNCTDVEYENKVYTIC